MKLVFAIGCLVWSTHLCVAGNLIPTGDFEKESLGHPVELTNNIDLLSVNGWRLFTSDAVDRTVVFEIVQDGVQKSKALKMEMTYNPTSSLDGRIGFDLYGHMLPVTAGSSFNLKFQAKSAGKKAGGIMVTLAAHRADESVVSQATEVFDPGVAFTQFTFPRWTVPPGATQMNVIFNLVEPGQQEQPQEPCGVVVDNIDLEKIGR